MKKRKWFIWAGVFVIAILILVVNAPKLLDRVFEKSVRILQKRVTQEAPSEYHLRIQKDFDALILAFREKRLDPEELKELSQLTKSIAEDGKFEEKEIDRLLHLIKRITSGT
jgi:hypothetical protein